MTGDPRRFLGQELDAETGFDHFGARQYRNVWGRFASVDPIFSSGAMTNPQLWNRYAYALNDPLRFSDPGGMRAVETESDSGAQPELAPYGVTFATTDFENWIDGILSQVKPMNLSLWGAQFIIGFEGYRGMPYPDGGYDSAGRPRGNWTIGYGHKIRPDEQFLCIDRDQATAIFNQDVREFVGYVNHYVKVPLSQTQFDIMVSLFYNAGPGNVAGSRLLKTINARGIPSLAEFMDFNTSGGRVMRGLQTRRFKEYMHFTGSWSLILPRVH
jgi:lysozyme